MRRTRLRHHSTANDHRRGHTVWLGALVVALAALGPALAGCGTEDDREALQVFAAASLTDVFADLERDFERSRPDVDVVLNLAGSSSLREQVLEGAPADVIATADAASMEPLLASGTVGDAEVFARNRLAIGVPAGNRAGVRGLDAFSDPDLLLGACQPGVPCGDLAADVFSVAGVQPSLDTEEPNVRALLTKIASGDLDAGIVYVTDVEAAPDVEGIEIPAAAGVVTEYPIAAVSGSSQAPTADAFIAFVRSEAGREILSQQGFELP